RHSARDFLLSPLRRHPPSHLGYGTRPGARAGETQHGARRDLRHPALCGAGLVGAARWSARAMSLRSPLATVLGQGSAKEGVHHWWVQRLTSIALVPLGVW